MSIMRHSGVSAPTDAVQDRTDDYLDADNLDFFHDALASFKQMGVGNGGRMVIGLVGERDLIGVCLRQAQAVVRFDKRPSKWSHVFLILEEAPEDKKKLGGLKVIEVTMNPRSGTVADPNSNGVTIGRLGSYASRLVTANVALLAVRMDSDQVDQVEAQARHPNRDRIRYNLWDSLAVWQGYYWAQGARPNPLGEGFPMFSSSYVEYAFEGIGLDLTPNASERNSTPEHVWNAARYWYESLEHQDHLISGFSVMRDPACAVLYESEVANAADVVARAVDEAMEGGA